MDLHELTGKPVNPDELQIEKASELVGFLKTEAFPFARFVEASREGDTEFVVLDIEPEVPQDTEYDIRTVERISVQFEPNDEHPPGAYALRRDFPDTPHRNITTSGQPRSLCLYEEPYTERRIQWTAAQFVRRLHEWLSLTAVGKLHDDDQPLERLFLGTPHRIVLPSKLFDPDAMAVPQRLSISRIARENGPWTLVAEKAAEETQYRDNGAPFVGFAYDAGPRTHGLIRVQPESLKELAAYLNEGDGNLIGTFRERLVEWKDSDEFNLDSTLILLVRLPKRRSDDDDVEAIEVWAFATANTIRDIGVSVGVWQKHDGKLARLLPVDEDKQGQDVELLLLNPVAALDMSTAADMNGLASRSLGKHVVVGVGALGSQVLMNLARAGQGCWMIVDQDQLLPHNVSRHALPGVAVGYSKAEVLSQFLNDLVEEEIALSVVEDALSKPSQELTSAYASAETIFDMSASVAVGRHLALGVDSEARRISLFLSPTGRDLVLLAESCDRAMRLDHLEMEYYRHIVVCDKMHDHLSHGGDQIRYANSCRDVSAKLPQDQVALHAAIGARAFRRAAEREEGQVQIWQSEEDLTCSTLSVEVSGYVEFQVGRWKLSVSKRTLNSIKRLRQERLPNETGGVLIGTFDTQRRRLYVAHQVPSPPDSEEWPTAYVRGVAGLKETLSDISEWTAGQLTYIGEWHSHPDSRSTRPSADDEELFEWLRQHRLRDGLPPVMAIVGDGNQTRWIVESLGASEEVTSSENELGDK